MFPSSTKLIFRKTLVTNIAFIFLCMPWYAHSALVTYEMSGTAVFSSNPIPGINLGDSFNASLTFDSDLATAMTFGVTPPFGPVSSTITYQTTSGDISFTSNTTSDAVFTALNDRTLGSDIVDEIQIFFDTGTVFEPRISYRFIDRDATVFPVGQSTFPININLNDWEFAGVTLIDSSDTQRDVRGDITSLTVIMVPEPSVLALFGAGLVGLGFAYRRKKAA